MSIRAVQPPRLRPESAADYLLAGTLGVLIAICLISWWAA
jgi:hypothetical protein